MKIFKNILKGILLAAIVLLIFGSMLWLLDKLDIDFAWVLGFALIAGVSVLFLAEQYWFGRNAVIFAVLLLTGLIALSFVPGIFFPPGRIKGTDAAIKGNLASIRLQAELYFDEHCRDLESKACYGPIFTLDKCPEDGQTIFYTEKNIYGAIQNAKKTSGQDVICAAEGETNGQSTAWAISSALKSDKKKYWCVDSTGVSREVPHHITEAKCPEGR